MDQEKNVEIKYFGRNEKIVNERLYEPFRRSISLQVEFENGDKWEIPQVSSYVYLPEYKTLNVTLYVDLGFSTHTVSVDLENEVRIINSYII